MDLPHQPRPVYPHFWERQTSSPRAEGIWGLFCFRESRDDDALYLSVSRGSTELSFPHSHREGPAEPHCYSARGLPTARPWLEASS